MQIYRNPYDYNCVFSVLVLHSLFPFYLALLLAQVFLLCMGCYFFSADCLLVTFPVSYFLASYSRGKGFDSKSGNTQFEENND